MRKIKGCNGYKIVHFLNLENKGILFYFQNENLISVNPMATIAYGGINLKIHPNDVLIVQTILDNLNNNLEIV